MLMMIPQILKSLDFTKTQKSRCLENETLFFLQIKKFINYTSRAILLQKNWFVLEVTFKQTKTIVYCRVIMLHRLISLLNLLGKFWTNLHKLCFRGKLLTSTTLHKGERWSVQICMVVDGGEWEARNFQLFSQT